MAEYHVGAGAFGIYCGTLNKPDKDGAITWHNKTECTDEAIRAVCDFLLFLCKLNPQLLATAKTYNKFVATTPHNACCWYVILSG